MTLNHDMPRTTGTTGSPWRVITATGVGNFVEWFDYAIYGFTATVIASQFFPSTDETASLLATFAVFAISFFLRPVGGLVFGAMGDRLGRRVTLMTTILLMAAGTTAIGLLPTYDNVGVLAPILLVVARCTQGLAAGGEYAGAASFVVEHSPPSRRGFFSSFLSCSTFFAFACGALFTSLLSAVLGQEAFSSWGWRLAFLVVTPLGLIGLYLRLKLEESPAFRRLQEEHSVAEAPIKEAFRTHARPMALHFVFFMNAIVMSYMLVAYIPTYLLKNSELSHDTVRLSNVVAILFLVACFPFFGLLCDRVGRRPVAILACILLAVVAIPGFLLIAEGSLGLVILGQCLLALPVAASNPVNTLLMTEFFPTRIRYSSAAVSYNSANMVVGGTAPLVAILLVSQTGSALAPAYYAAVIGVLALLAALRLPETRNRSLFEGDHIPAARFSREEPVATDEGTP